jgi:hypothetical protein
MRSHWRASRHIYQKRMRQLFQKLRICPRLSASCSSADDLDATKDDRKNIYILGYVTYQDSVDFDAFGNPEQRETRFCQKLVKGILKTIVVPTTPGTVPEVTGAVIPQALPEAGLTGQNCPAFSCMDSSCRPLR